jgi:hypothetical protein
VHEAGEEHRGTDQEERQEDLPGALEDLH